MKKLMSIGLLSCLALVGCTVTYPDDNQPPNSSVGREFTYTNKFGQVMNCVVWNEGYNYATTACVLAPAPVKKTTP